ncbi:tRNA (adenosine(37)-N6)-threonylcarbamoyltransferase complex dimerization subunit type 1 TsaB [Desulfococcaceae bacterium HSG9]|nr:tRNA (adenosine(37)-N6)-threonylcarbamoyltransferase complex dimerization subunit type 1 TsaB [Desulfococcaceae bacterium HSG9]
MKILAIDTATLSCSVALVDDDHLLAETTLVNEQTHSKHIMVLIQQVLDMSGVSVSDVDGFAATHGPGTFTGLRIGMSTVKGLAEAGDKPVAGVSSLAALAWQADPSLLICPLIDARRNEVYFAHYRFEDGKLKEVTPEAVGSVDEAIRKICSPCCFIGSGTSLYDDFIREQIGGLAVFAHGFQNTIRASTVAHLSRERLTDYDHVRDRDRFLPRYLRQSDAEIHLTKKLVT